MTFKSVFRCLQEVFPQMDLRILKAVAIEHSKDADAAVEFILSEVLPIISDSTEPSCIPDITRETEHSISNGQSITSEEISGTSYVDPSCIWETSEEGSHGDTNMPNLLLSHHEILKQKENLMPSKPEEVKSENDLVSDHKFDALSNSQLGDFEASVASLLTLDQVSNPQLEKAIMSTEAVQIYQNFTDECKSRDANIHEFSNSKSDWTFGENSNYISAFPSSIYQNNVNLEDLLGAKVENGMSTYMDVSDEQVSGTFKNVSNSQNFFDLEANNTAFSVFTSSEKTTSAPEFNSDSIEPQAEGITDTKTPPCFIEEKGPSYLTQNDVEPLASLNETVSTGDDTHTSTIALQSSRTTDIDFLNVCTTDAVKIKADLVSELNSAADLLKDVEINEERAKQAKEEASTAGQFILRKVVDLCQMVKNAKETNEKSAGEIYGEKSILAAETRELQSRLVSMSDERDKCFYVIEEIHRTLEARLAAAKAEMAVAEQEKLEKKNKARKALDEQEAVLDGIMQESQRLQQEAEENSKLREFLVDRGRIIDTLQGEIAALCEDVISLKGKVDDYVQIKKLLSSATTSLISSVSSYEPSASYEKSLPSESVHLSPVIENIGQADNEPKQQNPESIDDHKENSDDEWEIFHL